MQTADNCCYGLSVCVCVCANYKVLKIAHKRQSGWQKKQQQQSIGRWTMKMKLSRKRRTVICAIKKKRDNERRRNSAHWRFECVILVQTLVT